LQLVQLDVAAHEPRAADRDNRHRPSLPPRRAVRTPTILARYARTGWSVLGVRSAGRPSAPQISGVPVSYQNDGEGCRLRLIISPRTLLRWHADLVRRRWALQQNPPAGRSHPPAAGTNIRVLRRDRLGGLIHEYAQVAWGDRVIGTHTLSIPVSRTTFLTTSLIRSGRRDLAIRFRQYTSDDGSNPGSSSGAPIATFHRTSNRAASAASRSE
jgi:hypothetical protein